MPTMAFVVIEVQSLSHVKVFCDPWIAHQAPLYMGFPRQNTGLGCHFILQGIFPAQGLNPHHLCPALAVAFFTPRATWEACACVYVCVCVYDWIWLKLLLTLSTDRNSTLRILELPFKMEYKELRILISWFLFMEIALWKTV